MLSRIFLAPVALLYVAIVVLDGNPTLRRATAITAVVALVALVLFLR